MANDYPEVIEIQFHNQCNANCVICPYRSMGYVKDRMSDELFEKFVSELDESKLTRLIPYLNNEPFLDDTYIEKLKKIRKKCPNVELEISTNAVLLNREKIVSLKQFNLTELRISFFGFTKQTYTRMMPTSVYEKALENLHIISEEFKNEKTIVSVVMIDDGSIDENEFSQMETLTSQLGFEFCRWGFLDRAKNVSQKSNNFYREDVYDCEQNRPRTRMHILCDGTVIFCCQDWAHECVCGSIKENTISEVWLSEKYNNYRKALFHKNKCAPNICKNCKLAVYDK